MAGFLDGCWGFCKLERGGWGPGAGDCGVWRVGWVVGEKDECGDDVGGSGGGGGGEVFWVWAWIVYS